MSIESILTPQPSCPNCSKTVLKQPQTVTDWPKWSHAVPQCLKSSQNGLNFLQAVLKLLLSDPNHSHIYTNRSTNAQIVSQAEHIFQTSKTISPTMSPKLFLYLLISAKLLFVLGFVFFFRFRSCVDIYCVSTENRSSIVSLTGRRADHAVPIWESIQNEVQIMITVIYTANTTHAYTFSAIASSSSSSYILVIIVCGWPIQTMIKQAVTSILYSIASLNLKIL